MLLAVSDRSMDGLIEYAVIFTEQADIDRDKIIDELIHRKPLLGRQWLDAYERVESILENNPYVYQEHFLFVRRANLRRFPYVVYYVVDETDKIVLITAILHQKQDTSIILQRLNLDL